MWWEIRLAGRLPSYWPEWFDGFSAAVTAAGETVLTGRVPDQAALIGLLSSACRLNLTLLSVRRLSEQDGG
ncbi:MAG TPA: hypothetical protein VNT75_15950 [Symbiobacteriaceae bacterium]|nr:hypothetical protein [Symbiobacteriaceae bacterium]